MSFLLENGQHADPLCEALCRTREEVGMNWYHIAGEIDFYPQPFYRMESGQRGISVRAVSAAAYVLGYEKFIRHMIEVFAERPEMPGELIERPIRNMD